MLRAQALAPTALRALLRHIQRLAGEPGVSEAEPLFVLDTHKAAYYQFPTAKIDVALSVSSTVSFGGGCGFACSNHPFALGA
jgi:hypothetical protein